MKNNKIEIKPLFPSLKQQPQKTSWVIVNASSDDGVTVLFFNNDTAPDEDKYESFKDFAQSYFDEEFMNFDDKQIHINDDKACATGASSEEEEDFDEDNPRAKPKTIYVGKGQVIDIYKKVDLSKMNEIINQIKKDLNDAESNAAEGLADAAEYRKDPCKYYGVSNH